MLDPETKESEWQLSTAWQVYEYCGGMYQIELEDGSTLLVSSEHKVYGAPSSVGLVVVPESQENYPHLVMVDFVDKDEAFEDMYSSFSCEVASQRLVVCGVLEDFVHLIVQNLSEDRVLPAGFIDCFPADRLDFPVMHLDHSKRSEMDLNFMDGSFLAFSSSLMKDSFSGSSSTGCQSISSQNFQSLSESFPVLMYSSKILFLVNSSLATEDQLTQEKSFSSDLNTSGIDNVMLAILKISGKFLENAFPKGNNGSSIFHLLLQVPQTSEVALP